MDPIVINPTDLWQVIVAISGGIVTLSGAGAVVVAAVIQKIIHSEKMSSNVLVCPSKMW